MVNIHSLYGRMFLLTLFAVAGSVFAAAQTITGISDLVTTICMTLKSIFPILVFTLFMLAAVAYGIGNFFGAETRAKAQGWGMTALVSAIVVLVIYIIGPIIIGQMYTGGGTTSC